MMTSPGPPGGATFSLEGRPAPGLYVVAWLLGGVGVALFLVGIGASPGARLPFLMAGLLALGAGLASAAGYQILARAARPAEAYRGPSPVLAFALAAMIGLVIDAVLLGGLGLFDPGSPAGLLLGLIGVGSGYLAVIVLFVVRSGVLRWSEMGWPAGIGRFGHLLRDAVFGVAVTVPAVVPVLVFGALLATLLHVTPTDRIPLVETRFDAFLVVLAFAIVAPIGEELFFRGFAQSAWQRDLGLRPALIRAAFFFALVHILNQTGASFGEAAAGALLQFAVILPLGFILGWAFQRHGIAASIAGHMSYNGTLLLLAALTR
ncbi:MAG: lysostaphin resistance A-like protein [Candidatus Limnocylindrales bacterium]